MIKRTREINVNALKRNIFDVSCKDHVRDRKTDNCVTFERGEFNKQ